MANSNIKNIKQVNGFTLIEVMMGAAIMAIVSAALVGAFLGQSTLNMTAKNLTAAMTDATRVMEEIRKQNSPGSCAYNIPTAKPPANNTSWDSWLASVGRTMVLDQTTTFEKIAVTCQDAAAIVCAAGTKAQCPDGAEVNCPAAGQTATCPDNGPTVSRIARYCGSSVFNPYPAQVGTGEWKPNAINTKFNPIRVAVAVGWVQRNTLIGSNDFIYAGEATKTVGKSKVVVPATFTIQDDGDGIVTAQAMLTSVVTCR